jgi:hypothetical protein
MPTSQDWHVVIIGGPLTIRHRRAAKPRKIAMGIIADRAPLAKLSRWRCMAIAISMAAWAWSERGSGRPAATMYASPNSLDLFEIAFGSTTGVGAREK